MKIAIPTADYPPIEGGIGTVALQVSRELAALGHEVTVIAPQFEEMSAFDESEPVKVLRFRGYGLGWLRFFPMLTKSWRAINEADAVVAINVSYGGIMAWLLGKRFVALAYGYEFLKFSRTPIVANLLRKVYAASQKVIAISSYTRDQLIAFGVDAHQIAVVLPGATEGGPADPKRIAAVKQTHAESFDSVILAVGRFIERKGHETLIEAMPAVLERHPNAGLVLVGRGPRLEPARARADAVGLSNQITFTGYVSDDDLAALYELCDLFALPTGEAAQGHVEGFGLVFSEAHARGKPVVAGRSGGTVDAVLDGETGLIVEPDNPSATADAICALLDDPEYAAHLGEQGKARVERDLNWRAFTQQLLSTLEQSS